MLSDRTWLLVVVVLVGCAQPAPIVAPLPAPASVAPEPEPELPHLEPPTAEALCKEQLTRFFRALPGSAEVTLVTPRDDAALETWTADAFRQLEAAREIVGDKVFLSRRDPGPGDPQLLDVAVGTRRCGDAGTRGHACAEMTYRSASGLSLMNTEMSPGDFVEPILSILVALWREVETVKPRVGIVRRPGISFADPDLVPRAIGTTGHHMRERLAQYLPQVELVDVTLGQAAVDPSLLGLIVLQSTTPWSRADLERIDELVLRGDKALLVFAGAANLAPLDRSMTLALDTKGIDALLDGYGVSLERALVIDEPVAFDMQEYTVPQPPPKHMFGPGLFRARADDVFDPLKSQPQVAMHFPSPLQLHPDRQPGAVVRPILFSSPRAVKIDRDIALPPVASWQPPAGPSGEFVLGATAIGDLRSAFHPSAQHVRGRVVVIASPTFFANPYARAGSAAGPDDSGDLALIAAGWGYHPHWPWPDMLTAYLIAWVVNPIWACPEHWSAQARR